MFPINQNIGFSLEIRLYAFHEKVHHSCGYAGLKTQYKEIVEKSELRGKWMGVEINT